LPTRAKLSKYIESLEMVLSIENVKQFTSDTSSGRGRLKVRFSADQVEALRYFIDSPIKDIGREDSSDNENDLDVTDKKSLNELFNRYRSKIDETKFKNGVSKIRSNAQQRYDASVDYIDALFAVHGDLTFISLDLAYTDDYVLNKWQEELQSFFNGRRGHQTLRDIVGYIGKWECSPSKGIYARVIFIIPQKDVKDEATIIKLLGNYWNSYIMEGKGAYHRAKLASEPKEFRQTCCSIKQSNAKLREQFNETVLLYIAKVQIFYLDKKLENFTNILIKGNMPKRSLIKSVDNDDIMETINP
jgi:hypothetical protein